MSNQQCEYGGECLWFNNQRGIGFIKVCKRFETTDQHEVLHNVTDNEVCERNEVFVHFSDLATSEDVRKFLKPNEKVRFRLGKSLDKEGKMKAVDVKGIFGGPLDCETSRMIHHQMDRERPSRTGQPRRNFTRGGRPQRDDGRRMYNRRSDRSEDTDEFQETHETTETNTA